MVPSERLASTSTNEAARTGVLHPYPPPILPLRRQRRPSQNPPSRSGPRQQLRQDDAAPTSTSGGGITGYEDEGMFDALDGNTYANPRTVFSSSTSWEERQNRLQNRIRARIPTWQNTLMQRGPLLQEYKHHDNIARILCIQERVDASSQLHTCCQNADGTCTQSQLSPRVSMRKVMYCNLTCHGEIKVPLIHCSTCDVEFYTNPLDVGCWPSTPTEAASIWFVLDVHDAYMHFGLVEGLNATGEYFNIIK